MRALNLPPWLLPLAAAAAAVAAGAAQNHVADANADNG
jgi:hypothetical protein